MNCFDKALNFVADNFFVIWLWACAIASITLCVMSYVAFEDVIGDDAFNGIQPTDGDTTGVYPGHEWPMDGMGEEEPIVLHDTVHVEHSVNDVVDDELSSLSNPEFEQDTDDQNSDLTDESSEEAPLWKVYAHWSVTTGVLGVPGIAKKFAKRNDYFVPFVFFLLGLLMLPAMGYMSTFQMGIGSTWSIVLSCFAGTAFLAAGILGTNYIVKHRRQRSEESSEAAKQATFTEEQERQQEMKYKKEGIDEIFADVGSDIIHDTVDDQNVAEARLGEPSRTLSYHEEDSPDILILDGKQNEGRHPVPVDSSDDSTECEREPERGSFAYPFRGEGVLEGEASKSSLCDPEPIYENSIMSVPSLPDNDDRTWSEPSGYIRDMVLPEGQRRRLFELMCEIRASY